MDHRGYEMALGEMENRLAARSRESMAAASRFNHVSSALHLLIAFAAEDSEVRPRLQPLIDRVEKCMKSGGILLPLVVQHPLPDDISLSGLLGGLTS